MSKVEPTTPLLIMLYGFPGSGKSYVARQLSEHLQAAHLQGEKIRHEIFKSPTYDRQENQVVTQLLDYMTHEFLNAGISVIYDTNALRAAQRQNLRNLARKLHAQPLVIWLQIDIESAFLRTQQRDRRKADDRYASPLDRTTFDSILESMQNPTNIEDYVVISGKHVFNTQLSAILKKLNDMNLIRLHDANSGVPKPELTNLVPDPRAGRVDLNRRRNIIIR
jgi:predicted kinase